MKRQRDCASSSSSDKQKKTLLRDTIKCLTDPKSGSGLSYQPYEIQARQKPKEVDFLHKLHGWLMRGKEKKSKVQSDKNSVELKGLVEKLEKQVQQLKQQIDKFQHKDGFDDHERELSLFQEKVFVGTEFGENTTKILGWLKNSEACVIGVWGMGGVGKTALLKHISNKLIQDSAIFWPVYWLTVTHCDTIYKWQECVAKCIGLDLHDEDDETKRARKLYNTLAKRGNFVLMLDDMWHCFCAHEVGVPLGENSCKIILTTRLLDVCRRMRCKDLLIRVESLRTEEALKMFVDKLENYDMLTEEVRKIAGLIVDKCYGLPLAIVTMASRMIGVSDVDQWNDTCGELEMHEQDDMQNKVFSKLYCSYCFSDGIVQESFLSIIFNYDPFERAKCYYIDLLIDEGLLDKLEYGEKRIRKGYAIIDKLCDLCLLESEEDRLLEVNELIKGMAMHCARENHTHLMKANSELKEMPIDDIWSLDLVRVSLGENSIKRIRLDMSPRCVKLKVLILKQNPLEEIPECFFEHMISLTLLDLSETRIKRLPNSVSNLKNLRTLYLEGCDELTDVGAITKLMKLRKLNLCGAHVHEAVTEMEILKYLEVFDFTWNASHWSHLDKLMESWPFCSIRSYYFSIQNKSVLLLNRYRDEPEVKELKIKGMELGREIKIHHLPFGIERLVISECEVKGIRNLGDVFPSLHTATKLKELELTSCLGMEYVLSAIPPVASLFPQLDKLEVLCLSNMPDWRGIIKIEGKETEQPSQIPQSIVAFSHLQRISIDSCPKIKSLIPFNLIQHPHCLSNLGSISLRNCEGLENIFEFLPSPCPSPLNIWGGPQLGGAYLSLEELHIHGCNEIKEVFSFDLVQNLQPFLPNLEQIHVSRCQKMEAIFGSPNSRTSRALDLRKLTLLKLDSLPKLRSICSGVLLPSLHNLRIWWCHGIKEVFQLDLSQSQPLFSTLESIYVSGCKNLEVVIGFSNDGANPTLGQTYMRLPRLANLNLRYLPNFQSIYRGMLICTALDKLDIEDCPNYRPLEQLSKSLLCDASEKTLASIPKYDADNLWWGHMKSSYPEDASTLSKLVHDFWASKRSWGLNLSTMCPNKVSFQSGMAAVNPVFALPRFAMNHSTTEGFSNAGRPETEQFVPVYPQTHTWTVSAVMEVDNTNLMFGAMNAQSVSQLPYDQRPPFPVNNRVSYDGAGCSYNMPGAGNYQPFNQ